MAEHVALIKRLGNSDRSLRSARPDRGFVRRRAVHCVARHHGQQVLRLAGSYGKVNEHNGWVPRDFWLEDWEKQAIIGFHLKNPLEGYRRLTFMMLDADIVAVSPSGVWRVHGLRAAAGSTSAVAHRCFLPEHRRDVLLPVQHP